MKKSSENLLRNTPDSSNFHVIIPTYNRPEQCEKLINNIREQNDNVYISVYNDGSTLDYPDLDVDFYLKFKDNGGKQGFWRLVRSAFNTISEADYYIMIGDDMELVPNFFNQAVRQWNIIREKKKICLNLMTDNRTKCWTRFERRGAYGMYLTQWNDLCFIAEKEFFNQVNIKPVPLSRWNHNKQLGSGVGQQVSEQLYSKGYYMYQVKKSLVRHGNHESKMNYQARKNNPLNDL